VAQQQPQPQQQQQQTQQHTQSTAVSSDARVTRGRYSLADFELLRTLGTGSFGRVHLVQSQHNSRFYAIKVLKKAQVVRMKQVEHTNDERRMLSEVKHPFLITLWGTFQDAKNLYMVMDFVEGGELFSLLRRSGVCAYRGMTGLMRWAWANSVGSASPTRSPSSTLPKSHWLSNTYTHETSSTET
jgi:protein kinase A